MFCTLLLALPIVLNRVERGSFVGLVAARHVRASKSGFLTVISVLSIAGVALSSLALCAVISIMGGFGADLKRKILGNNAHISVDRGRVGGFGDWDRALDDVRLVPGVVAATPVAGGEAMASSNSNTSGVLVRGVEPETVAQVIDLVSNIEVGDFDYLGQPERLIDLPPNTVIGLGPGGQPYLKGSAKSTWNGGAAEGP
jgi:lipoprotein-releasing system permease protein